MKRGNQPYWHRWLALAAVVALIMTVITLFSDETGKEYVSLREAKAATPEGWENYVDYYELLEEHPVDIAFYESLREFSFRTMSTLSEGREAGEENLLYSPLSFYYA